MTTDQATQRIQYRCMACPQEFSDAEASNAHHDETGHNQTHRCWDHVCGMALFRHSDAEYVRCWNNRPSRSSVPAPRPSETPLPDIGSCPFCGNADFGEGLVNDNVGVMYKASGNEATPWYRVICRECGVFTAGDGDKAKAIEQWNQRYPLPPAPFGVQLIAQRLEKDAGNIEPDRIAELIRTSWVAAAIYNLMRHEHERQSPSVPTAIQEQREALAAVVESIAARKAVEAEQDAAGREGRLQNNSQCPSWNRYVEAQAKVWPALEKWAARVQGEDA